MTILPHDLTAIILVGGLGKRLRSVVSDVPKPMASVNGRPFLEHQLAFLAQSGVTKVIFAVGYMANIVERHFGKSWNGIQILYSREKKPLGTGGAMIKAARLVGDGTSALIMNGDTYFPVSLTKMLHDHITTNASISIAMFESTEPGRYSPFGVAANMQIVTASDESSRLKSGGVYIFSSDMVANLSKRQVVKTSFETDLTPAFLIENITMTAYLEHCPFVDIGVPSDYVKAGKIIESVTSVR